MLLWIKIQLLWYWLQGMDYTQQYKMLERRRVFLRMMVEEKRKQMIGMVYNKPLLLSCEKYLEAMPKPRFTVYAESTPITRPSAAVITKKYDKASNYDQSWPEIHDSYYV